MTLKNRNIYYVPGALLLIETLPYLNILPWDTSSRWFIHEPLLLIACLPFLPRLWRSSVLNRGYWVFLIWTTITISYTPQPVVAAGRFLPAILILAALSEVVVRIRDQHDVHTTLSYFLKACACLVALNTLAEILFPNSVSFDASWGAYAWVTSWQTHDRVSPVIRFCGFLGEPNEVGQLMLVTLMAGALHWPQCQWRKALAVVMLLATLEGAMADSRTVFVAMIIGFGAYAAWKFGTRGRVAAIGALLLLALLRTSTNPWISRDLEGFNGRTTLWDFEIQQISEHPLIGYGYGIGSGLIIQSKHFPDWDEAFTDPHASLQNGYLEIAAELGVIAFIGWMFLFLKPWFSLFWHRNNKVLLKDAFFIVVVPTLIFAMSETGISEPRGPLGLLVFTFWMIAEKYRVARLVSEGRDRVPVLKPNGIDFRKLLAS